MHEKLSFEINDADNHFVEPEDMYERYIDPRFREKAVRFVYDSQGRRVQLFGGRPSKLQFTRESAPQSEEEQALHAREAGPRKRHSLAEQVFSGKWGEKAAFLP